MEELLESIDIPAFDIFLENIKFGLTENLHIQKIMEDKPDIVSGGGCWTIDVDSDHWSLKSIVLGLDVLLRNQSNSIPLNGFTIRKICLVTEFLAVVLLNFVLNEDLEVSRIIRSADVVSQMLDLAEIDWGLISISIKRGLVRLWDESHESFSDIDAEFSTFDELVPKIGDRSIGIFDTNMLLQLSVIVIMI